MAGVEENMAEKQTMKLVRESGQLLAEGADAVERLAAENQRLQSQVNASEQQEVNMMDGIKKLQEKVEKLTLDLERAKAREEEARKEQEYRSNLLTENAREQERLIDSLQARVEELRLENESLQQTSFAQERKEIQHAETPAKPKERRTRDLPPSVDHDSPSFMRPTKNWTQRSGEKKPRPSSPLKASPLPLPNAKSKK
jgi:DNA repair exonuclease SbcCD ATPase subunit